MTITRYGHRSLDSDVHAAGWNHAGGMLLSTTPHRYLLALAASWYDHTHASPGRIVLQTMSPVSFLAPEATRVSGLIQGACWFAVAASRSLAAIATRLGEDPNRAACLDNPGQVPVRLVFETDATVAVLRMTAPQAVPAAVWPQVDADDRAVLTTVCFDELARAVAAEWAAAVG